MRNVYYGESIFKQAEFCNSPSAFAVNQGIGAFLRGLGSGLRRFKCSYRDPYAHDGYNYKRPIQYEWREELFAPV